MRILCYGDSNTWGCVPNVSGYSKNCVAKQYKREDCWWCTLTVNNEVFVDGVCGRCIAHESKWLENRNASVTVYDDLACYDCLDVVIVWLGANDCKSMYGDTANDIVDNLENLVKTIEDITKAKIVIISPVCIKENTPITQKYYLGAYEKSIELDALYRELAKRKGYMFVSGVDLAVGEDGEHLTLSGHKELSIRIDKILKNVKLKND